MQSNLITTSFYFSLFICLCQFFCFHHDVYLDIRDEDGHTPLLIACCFDQLESLKRLLALGADSMQTDEATAFTIAHVCAQNGAVACMDHVLKVCPELLNKPASDGVTPLHIACQVSARSPGQITLFSNKFCFLCLRVIQFDEHQVAKVLIDAGADLNAISESHLTPLHIAATTGGVNSIALLCDAMKNIDPRATDELTPLHLAALGGYVSHANTP
jgi:ankyrin repeat protein